MGPQAGGPTVVVPTVDPDHPVERGDDGLGEELRVLLAHSMRNGHHQLPRPGGMTRLDPVR